MNEYSRGVFECLSWAEAKMAELEGREDRWEALHAEIGIVIGDIRRGVGVEFRSRLRARL